MSSALFLYSGDLAGFDYGDDHPFKPMRARNTLELCDRYGLVYVDGVVNREPTPADPALLELFHEPEYLQVLRNVSQGQRDLRCLERGMGTDDCPILLGIWEFCLLATGATMQAVQAVRSGEFRRAFNLVGGFHHAYRDHAEGFCYVNDVGVAIASLRKQGLRVAFVDIDAHHCNGVQDAFYDDPGALIISLHESGRSLYPWGGQETELGTGPGLGFNINLPLLEQTDDEVYLRAFEAVVPPALQAFRPDIVIAEIGADTQLSDPLTHLRLTNNGFSAAVQRLCELSPKLVALGGGGYDVFRTARCWTRGWGAMCELEPEDEMAGLVGGMMFGGGLGELNDPQITTKGEPKERAQAEAERVVTFLREHALARLGAR